MEYKVGDKVRTKSIDWYKEHALIDTSGVFRTSIESLCPNKKRFMGKELTISSVLSNRHYLMEETGALRWTDEMIEGLVEEEIKPKFKVGDKITNGEITFTILRLSSDRYGAEDTFGECGSVCFKSQDDWKIVEEETKPKFKVGDRVFNIATKKSVNIIEWDEETGLYIVRYDDGVQGRSLESELKRLEHITWDDVKDETKSKDMGEVSDGYHTFNELYEYRMLYNAALFNEFAKQGLYDVHKSRKHSNGEYPFGDSNWFIVMAELPTGQISNHYEMKDWDKFQIPEKEVANKWDGHSPRDVADRLISFMNYKNEIKNTIGKLEVEPICDAYDTCYGTRAPSNFELMDKINELIDEINRLKNGYEK